MRGLVEGKGSWSQWQRPEQLQSCNMQMQKPRSLLQPSILHHTRDKEGGQQGTGGQDSPSLSSCRKNHGGGQCRGHAGQRVAVAVDVRCNDSSVGPDGFRPAAARGQVRGGTVL